MGGVAEVLGVESDGDVKVDHGGDDSLIADDFHGSGVDAPPLPGDFASLVPGPEAGTQQINGYSDDRDGVAVPGERRTYARDSTGTIVAVIWLKANGDLELTTPGGGKFKFGAAAQSLLRGEDLHTYLDGVILAVSTGFGAVPVAGAAIKMAFDTAIAALSTLKTATLSTTMKGE